MTGVPMRREKCGHRHTEKVKGQKVRRSEGQKKDRSHGLALRAIKDGRHHQKLGAGPGTECPPDGPEGTALPTS